MIVRALVRLGLGERLGDVSGFGVWGLGLGLGLWCITNM